ncbi:MAG: hypothetical protein AAGH57_08995 [Pseudomonadota bacterium]
MIYILDNILAILAASAVGLALGLAALRLSSGLLPHPGALIVIALAEFWMTCILAGALILAPPQAPIWVMALATPFVIWIGFVVPVIAVSGAVSELSRRSALRTSLHWLIVMLAIAATLQAIGLRPPSAA